MKRSARNMAIWFVLDLIVIGGIIAALLYCFGKR